MTTSDDTTGRDYEAIAYRLAEELLEQRGIAPDTDCPMDCSTQPCVDGRVDCWIEWAVAKLNEPEPVQVPFYMGTSRKPFTPIRIPIPGE